MTDPLISKFHSKVLCKKNTALASCGFHTNDITTKHQLNYLQFVAYGAKDPHNNQHCDGKVALPVLATAATVRMSPPRNLHLDVTIVDSIRLAPERQGGNLSRAVVHHPGLPTLDHISVIPV